MDRNPTESTKRDHEHLKTVGRKTDRGWFFEEDAMFSSICKEAAAVHVNFLSSYSVKTLNVHSRK